MGTLSSCLKKIGLSEHESAIIRGYTNENIEDGDDKHVAAVRAVSDYLERLDRERSAIGEKVVAAGAKMPAAPFKLTEVSSLTAVLRKNAEPIAKSEWSEASNGFDGSKVYNFNPESGAYWASMKQLLGNSFAITYFKGQQEIDTDEVAGSLTSAKLMVAEKVRGMQPAVEGSGIHIEAGEIERVTPAVIAESAKTSARNTDFNPKEALAWIQNAVKQAIKDAPTASEKGIWSNGKIDTKNIMNLDEAVGFKVFDVPGDGKFKVLNVKEKLQSFLDQVEKSPGFKNPRKPAAEQTVAPWQKTSGSGSEAEVREMLVDGDYTAAYEFSKQIGKPIVFGYSAKEKPVPYTDVRAFEIEGYEDFHFVVGRSWSDKDSSGRWHVIETSTGLSVGNASTKKAVEAQVRGSLVGKNMTPEKLATVVADAIKKGDGKSQSQLEAEWLAWAEEKEGGSPLLSDKSAEPANTVAESATVQEQNPEARLDATGKQSDNGWHGAGIGAGGRRQMKRQIELPDGTDIEATLTEHAGRYDNGYVYVNGKEVFRTDDSFDAQGQIDKFIEGRYLSQAQIDNKGFERFNVNSNGAFELRDGNMIVRVEPTENGKYQASFRGAKSSPHLQGIQGAIDWADAYRQESMRAEQKQEASSKQVKGENGNAATASKSEPNPLDHTPKQYHEAMLQYIADENGVSLGEVRENYDTEAGRKEHDLGWINAVRAAARDGVELSRQTLDKLHELNDSAVAELMHDYPDAKLPNGYQVPAARATEKQNTDDRKQDRLKTRQTTKERSADAGEELTYNKRNRRKDGLRWEDIEDKNATLQAKEVVKAKVYPKPDYAAMVAGGMKPLIAHMVKQVYDGIASSPRLSRGMVLSDVTMKAYIDGVNRVMDGVMKWANDADAVASWAGRQVRMTGPTFNVMDTFSKNDTPLSFVYPNGHKERQAEVYYLGGNKFYGALQPGHDEVRRAMKDMKLGWPEKAEAWKKQGYKIVEATPLTAILRAIERKGQEPFVYAYIVKDEGKGTGPTVTAFSIKGTGSIDDKSVQEAVQAAIEKYNGKFVLQNKGGTLIGAFNTIEEAEEGARDATRKARDDGAVKEIGRVVTEVQRVGAERRMEGQDVTSHDLKDTFGFRGVNFGDAMQGESKALVKERQLHLNHMYDSFMDLAELLNLPPKALSLNGMLGVAVGAQGSGKALAHFVPGVNEINITRRAGAGALAHEWGHALDHYFGTMAGAATQQRPYMTELVSGAKKETVRVDGQWVTRDKTTGDVRPEVADQFRSIVDAMKKRPETPEERTARLEEGKEKALKGVGQWMTYFRKELDKVEGDHAATLSKMDALEKRMSDVDFGDGVIAVGKNIEVHPVVADLKTALEEAGAKITDAKYWHGLSIQLDRLKAFDDMLKFTGEHTPQIVDTSYFKASKAADGKTKRDYWASTLEMFARAFDAYVVDSLEAKSAKNQYLSGIEAVAPAGNERATINRAFDFLFAELKHRETERGIEVYQSNPFTSYHERAKEFNELPDESRVFQLGTAGADNGNVRRGGVSRIGRTIGNASPSRQIVDAGITDLRGAKINGPEDLADIAQVYRNPNYETMRYFFVKDGVIVSQNAVSSRLPSSSKVFVGVTKEEQAAWINRITNEAKSLGADGVYLLHNHPNGDPSASYEDFMATLTMMNELESRGVRLLDHVIINHNKYGVIDTTFIDGEERLRRRVVTKEYNADEQYSFKNPKQAHAVLGATVVGPKDVAITAKKAQVSAGQVVIVGSAGSNGVSLLAEMTPAQITNPKFAIAALRRMARQSGSANLYAYGLPYASMNQLARIIRQGILTDAIVIDNQGVEWSVAGVTGAYPEQGMHFGIKTAGKEVSQNAPMASKDAQRTNTSPSEVRGALIGKFGATGISALEGSGMLKIVRLKDAPATIRDEAIAQGASAMYSNGVAYIFSDRITADEAPGKLLHEIGEHYGLEKMLGSDGWSNIRRRIATMAKARGSLAYGAWQGVKANYTEFDGLSDAELASNDRFLHEVLAAIGENKAGLTTSVWRELLAKIKAWLAEKGIATDWMNEGDIANLVSGSLKKVMREAAMPQSIYNAQTEFSKELNNGTANAGRIAGAQEQSTRRDAEGFSTRSGSVRSGGVFDDEGIYGKDAGAYASKPIESVADSAKSPLVAQPTMDDIVTDNFRKIVAAMKSANQLIEDCA